MRKKITHNHPAPAPRPRRRAQPPVIPTTGWTEPLLLHLESPDPNLLDKETAKLYNRLRQSGAEIHGPVPLPVSGPEGEAPPALSPGPRVHRRVFKVLHPTGETITLLQKLTLSGAVYALVQVEEQEASGPWPVVT